jgi:hypothetical protein
MLAARNDAAALLVISTGAGVPASLDRRERRWLPMLQQWHDRAWLTPINHPLYWRRELRQPQIVRVPVWSMTGAGIVAAARAITGGDTQSTLQPAEGVRAVSVDDVERMKRLIALVPYPSLDLAEQLRQRFLPSVPEDVLLFLAESGAGRNVDTIRLDPDEIRRLAAAERHDDPMQELEVRRFLRAMLEASKPAEGSVAHARWQLDAAVQELHLSTLAPDDYAVPTATIEALANSPIADEVAEALRLATAASGDSRAVVRLQRRAAAATVTAGLRDRPGSRWTWPGLAAPLAAAGAALLAFAILNEWGPFPSRAIAHETDAYLLEYVEPFYDNEPVTLQAQRLTGRQTTPASADLYRGSDRVATLTFSSDNTAVAPVAADQGNAWYWLRAALPSGNLATSNFVWVPPLGPPDPVQPVTVVVNVLPWARVQITTPDGTGTATPGTFVTPFAVALRPGNYQLQCENGGLNAANPFYVIVAPSTQPQVVTLTMPGFNPDRQADNLLGLAAGPTQK